MPLVRKRYARKSKKPVYRRRRQFGGYRRKARNTSTSQVFSETYKCGTECGGVNVSGEIALAAGNFGQGFKLITQMNVVPQNAEYSKLWSTYKIIKAKYTIVPKWGNETYNEAAIGTAAALGISENRRIAYAINDMDDGATPIAELPVLQDNGCKIRLFNKPIVVTLRPKPVLQQAGGLVTGLPFVTTYQNRGQWLSFDGAGTTVQHIGVDGQISATNSLQSGFMTLADVQCTVTFVCKDPR